MYSDDEITQLWAEKVCKWHDKETEDTLEESYWSSIWVGFMLALDRPDLIDYQSYMRLGFPQECLRSNYANRP